jgi:hypothetical protein
MLGAGPPRTTAMTIVTGKTKNGFTYKGAASTQAPIALRGRPSTGVAITFMECGTVASTN